MANSTVSKAARSAARKAATAAHEELLKRFRANEEDLARFFTARDRLAGVEASFNKQRALLEERRKARWAMENASMGSALRAMRDRGESVEEIARLANIETKAVRELIKLGETPDNGQQST